MRRLFDLDAPIVRAVGRLGNLMLLNVWWFICCLPVVTAGSSCTAMHALMLRMRRDESCSTADFFREFRGNIKKPTLIWLILIAGGVVLALGYMLSASAGIPDAVRMVMLAVFCALLFMYITAAVYVFPMTAYFENDVWATFAAALYTGVRNLRSTVVIAALTLIPAVAALVSLYWFLWLGFVWLFIYPGLAFYAKSKYFAEIFDKQDIK